MFQRENTQMILSQTITSILKFALIISMTFGILVWCTYLLWQRDALKLFWWTLLSSWVLQNVSLPATKWISKHYCLVTLSSFRIHSFVKQSRCKIILECQILYPHHVLHGWELEPWWSRLTLHPLLHKHLLGNCATQSDPVFKILIHLSEMMIIR